MWAGLEPKPAVWRGVGVFGKLTADRGGSVKMCVRWAVFVLGGWLLWQMSPQKWGQVAKSFKCHG